MMDRLSCNPYICAASKRFTCIWISVELREITGSNVPFHLQWVVSLIGDILFYFNSLIRRKPGLLGSITILSREGRLRETLQIYS